MIIILECNFGFSQTKWINNASVVFSGSEDTVKTSVLVGLNLFDKTLIDECSASFNPVLSEGKVKAHEIEYLSFLDLKNVKRVFVNGRIMSKATKPNLVEIMHDGKIIWYRQLYRNQGCSAKDYLVKGDEKLKFQAGNQPRKKALLRLTDDSPQMIPIINSILNSGDHWTKKESDIKHVLSKYDSLLLTQSSN